MRKLTLLLITICALVFTANTYAQQVATDEGVEWKAGTTPEWTKFNNPHIVALGSKYEYAVEKHETYTLAGLKKFINDQNSAMAAGVDINTNRYVWELFSVTVPDPVTTPKEYIIGSSVETSGDFNVPSIINNHEYNWAGKTTGDYFLIRVKEYANHALDANEYSKAADLATVTISEILVRIGDKINITIPTDKDVDVVDKDGVAQKIKNGMDAYLCSVDGPTVSKFDERFGATFLKCNGRPVGDKFEVVLSVEKTKKGNPLEVKDIIISKTVDLTKDYDSATGYYSLSILLADIQTALGTSLDLDATSDDVYYEVSVKGYVHADTDPASTDAVGTTKYTAVVGSAADGLAANEKAKRIYGVYTKPEITKINHK